MPRQAQFDVLMGGCGGSAIWRGRKRAELREVLALAEVSSRFEVLHADVGAAMRFALELRLPVPTFPHPEGDLVVEEQAMIALTYPEEALYTPQSGQAFVWVLKPDHLWLANAAAPPTELGDPDPTGVSGRGPQVLCLGAQLPAAIPVKELILRTFAALTLQSIQLDPRDPAGLLNPAAARWWLQNRERIPLTSEGFITKSIQP